jgi:hypothetical protein
VTVYRTKGASDLDSLSYPERRVLASLYYPKDRKGKYRHCSTITQRSALEVRYVDIPFWAIRWHIVRMLWKKGLVLAESHRWCSFYDPVTRELRTDHLRYFPRYVVSLTDYGFETARALDQS